MKYALTAIGIVLAIYIAFFGWLYQSWKATLPADELLETPVVIEPEKPVAPEQVPEKPVLTATSTGEIKKAELQEIKEAIELAEEQLELTIVLDDITVHNIIAYTNLARKQSGLARYKISDRLAYAATLKATDMNGKQYFSHEDPEGHKFFYWITKADYTFKSAGENLAVTYTDALGDDLWGMRRLFDAWMESETHRRNIMHTYYTEMGVAMVEGMYKGKPALFIAVEFARPSYPHP